MALPVVVTYNVGTGNATSIVNAAAATSSPLTLATTFMPNFPLQQRVLVTSTGNDSSLFFRIVGLNQAGFTVSEFLPGTNATFAQSNLDYAKIVSIQGSSSSTALVPSATANTVSAGVSTTGGVGSSMWNIVNWHAMPSNISYGCILQSNNATFSIQYTYDDPNNLPPGVTVPTAFNHPIITNATASIDGFSNDPITAWRLTVSAGTGIIRAIGIQTGIGSP